MEAEPGDPDDERKSRPVRSRPRRELAGRLQRTPDQVLDDAANGAIAAGKGTVSGRKPISLGPYPGREFLLETTPKTETGTTFTFLMTTRIYLVENRLYQVTRAVTPESDGPVDAARFFESFTVTR